MNFEELRTRCMYTHVTEHEVMKLKSQHTIDNTHDFKIVFGLPESCVIWETFTDPTTNDTTHTILDESFEIIEPGNKMPIFKTPWQL